MKTNLSGGQKASLIAALAAALLLLTQPPPPPVRASSQNGSGEEKPRPTPSPRRNNNAASSAKREGAPTPPRPRRSAALAWADWAKDYLVNDRGISVDRVVVVDGGCRSDFAVELWVVPPGAKLPPAKSTKPCPRRAGLDSRPGLSGSFVKAGYRLTTAAAAPSRQVTRQEVPCPTVDVSCPDTAKPGELVTFTVSVSGGATYVKPTFNWTVSPGAVRKGRRGRKGQSEGDTLTIDTTGLPNDSTVTATVDVGGFARDCSTSDSCTVNLLAKPDARKIDEYSDIRPGNQQSRLDNFAIELQNDPLAHGCIVVYTRAR